MKSSAKLFVLLYLVIAIVAVWLLAAADWIVPIKKMYGAAFYEPLVAAGTTKVVLGSLALFAFPFVTLGLRSLFLATKIRWMLPLVYLFTGTITISMHTSYYYYYQVARHLQQMPELQVILNDFDKYKDAMGTAYFVGLGLLCLCLLGVVAAGKSAFPRFFAVFNPVVGVIILSVVGAINHAAAEAIRPIFIPATMLAVMVTVYLCYLYVTQHQLIDKDRIKASASQHGRK